MHRLVDELPESELAAAERVLHSLRATTDPVLRAPLEAPMDDESETEAERLAVNEAQDELRTRRGADAGGGAARVRPVSWLAVFITRLALPARA